MTNIESTRKKLIELVQHNIDEKRRLVGNNREECNLAEYIVTTDFIEQVKELFLEDMYRSQT